MQIFKLYIIIFVICSHFSIVRATSSNYSESRHKAFVYKMLDLGVSNTINTCYNSEQIPFRYEANLNMPVCDDKLCANVYLKVYWDLAGNYICFDTIAGKPLTKFDHNPFTQADYKKLDQILNDRNSILRVLDKDELVDKSIKLKSTAVDAVTGATPATIKNEVVEGAVYSAYSLWHFVNGSVKDSIKHYTLQIYSDKIAEQMLHSSNFETQLFALKNLDNSFFDANTTLIFDIIKKSNPLVRAFIINKISTPFSNQDKNKVYAQLYSALDSYSKSIFCDKIVSSKVLAVVFIPLMIRIYQIKDEVITKKMQQAAIKYNLPGNAF